MLFLEYRENQGMSIGCLEKIEKLPRGIGQNNEKTGDKRDILNRENIWIFFEVKRPG